MAAWRPDQERNDIDVVMLQQRKLMMKSEPPPVLLADSDAAAMFGISRSTFWRRVGDGTFPQPIRIHGIIRWVREDLEEAVTRMKSP